MWRKGLILAISAILAFAQEAPIRREGTHWIQVLTGSLPAPPDCRLKVETRGPVTLQGRWADRIAYTIKKRVRARTEAEARALLNDAAIRTTSRNGLATITLARRARPAVSAEMELSARSDMRFASIDTTGGDLQIYDILGSVEAESAGGLIRMDRIGSDISAKTGGGEIQLGNIAGSIRCSPAADRSTWTEPGKSRGWKQRAATFQCGKAAAQFTPGPRAATFRCSAPRQWYRPAPPGEELKFSEPME